MLYPKLFVNWEVISHAVIINFGNASFLYCDTVLFPTFRKLYDPCTRRKRTACPKLPRPIPETLPPSVVTAVKTPKCCSVKFISYQVSDVLRLESWSYLMCSVSVHYIIQNTNHQQMHKETFIINRNTLLHVSSMLGHLQGELFVTVTLGLHGNEKFSLKMTQHARNM
jgi:hypothetical protein